MLIEITEIQTCLVVYRVTAESIEAYRQGYWEYDDTVCDECIEAKEEAIEIID
jgi:hypothetical protein